MYVCEVCGYATAVKIGKCPECGSFGSFKEDPTGSRSKSKTQKWKIWWQALELGEKKLSRRLPLLNPELVRLFPQGLKEGGVYLLGGEPGIGKSTIVLQIIQELSDVRIAYFSGEEQVSQIAERNSRLQKWERDIVTEEGFDTYHTTSLEDIILTAETGQYEFIIIDSIQTISSENTESSAGSPAQIRYCAEQIAKMCKQKGITALITGHVTKGGEIAGPKYLEHLVDVVLYLEWDRYGQYRMLRCVKNRYGSTDEVGIFEMTPHGLIPVSDLKNRLISGAHLGIPGSVLWVGIDNGRPVVVHLEVLLNKSQGKYPTHQVVGVDAKRVDLILAILEKYLKANLSWSDVFVNIPGEFSFRDSWLDLAIAAGIYSQHKNLVIDSSLVFLGEIGLGWQILPTKLHEKRRKEMEGMTIIDHTRIKHISELPNLL